MAATAHTIHITPSNTGLYSVPQSAPVAEKATSLLQQDLAQHHVFFNNDGFHNHIVHHILSLYGTGASAADLQFGYDHNAGYQRPPMPEHERVPVDLREKGPEGWGEYLGKERYYPDFLRFFQEEIERVGWEETLGEYVFKGTEAADDLLVRLFAGFLHPLIQLMYGMEWSQPAIVAEGLAQACVHSAEGLTEFLLNSESLSKSSSSPTPSILSLYQAVASNPKLSKAARMEDANKVRDGVLAREKEEMIQLAARVKVLEEELDERTAEMFDACVYVGAAAALQHWPGKGPKWDFFLIHHINSAPIFLTINSQPWIPLSVKTRLLEWKIRMDLLQYAARAVPPLLDTDTITSYQSPSSPSSTFDASPSIHSLIARLHSLPDDGHAIKLARAAAICQQLTRPYVEGKKGWVQIRGEEMWAAVMRVVVDSVTSGGPTWVRSTGLEGAWKEVEDRSRL